MPKRVYTPAPVSPDMHLEQLRELRDKKDDGSLNPVQQLAAKSILGRRTLKALRVKHIRELVVAGYTTEEIKIAFATPSSRFAPLLDGLEGRTGYKTFLSEISDAFTWRDEQGLDVHRDAYIRSRQQLLDACWGVIPKMEASHAKGLIELMDKLVQDIAEARGVLKQRAGKRPSTRRGGRDISPTAEETGDQPATTPDENPEDVKPDWEGEFEADDDPTNPTASAE